MTTDSMHKALVDAAERSLTTSDHTHDDILQLAEVAATLQAQQLAGNLLGLIRVRVKSDAAANYFLPGAGRETVAWASGVVSAPRPQRSVAE
jgi:hypothetical protein